PRPATDTRLRSTVAAQWQLRFRGQPAKCLGRRTFALHTGQQPSSPLRDLPGSQRRVVVHSTILSPAAAIAGRRDRPERSLLVELSACNVAARDHGGSSLDRACLGSRTRASTTR